MPNPAIKKTNGKNLRSGIDFCARRAYNSLKQTVRDIASRLTWKL